MLWPFSIIVNQITLFALDGVWYSGYLIQHPFFILTDILMPIFLVFILEFLRERKIHGEYRLNETRLQGSPTE